MLADIMMDPTVGGLATDPAVADVVLNSKLSLAAFILGATQLTKKLGLEGNQLILAAFAWGVFAKLMMVYAPEVWAGLGEVLIALTLTGLVSFVDDRIQKMNRSPAE